MAPAARRHRGQGGGHDGDHPGRHGGPVVLRLPLGLGPPAHRLVRLRRLSPARYPGPGYRAPRSPARLRARGEPASPAGNHVSVTLTWSGAGLVHVDVTTTWL